MQKKREKIEWLEMVIPKEHLEKFEVEEIIKTREEVLVKLKEDKGQKPIVRNNGRLVLNGYDKSVEILTGSLNGRAVLVRYTCRKWLDPETKITYRNQYGFHPKGIKTSHEFADFLKEEDREKSIHLLTGRRDVWDSGEEDVSMV